MLDAIRERVRRLTPLFADSNPGQALGPGPLAELRRLDVERPSAAAFWTIVAHELDPDLPPDGEPEARCEAERRWAIALQAMAVLAGLHRKDPRLGAALASAEFSEMRLQRLLGCADDRLAVEVASVARYLAAKGAACDVADLVCLVVERDAVAVERVRRGIARDYFRVIARGKGKSSSTDERSVE